MAARTLVVQVVQLVLLRSMDRVPGMANGAHTNAAGCQAKQLRAEGVVEARCTGVAWDVDDNHGLVRQAVDRVEPRCAVAQQFRNLGAVAVDATPALEPVAVFVLHDM